MVSDVRAVAVVEGATVVIGPPVIEHNTGIHTGNLVTADGRPNSGFVFRDNIGFQNAYGIIGTGVSPGNATLAAFFPGAVVRRNVLVGGHSSQYPPDNFFPSSVDAVGFVDPSVGNYLLGPGSPYKGSATDGTDVGADIATIKATRQPRPLPPKVPPRPPVAG